MAWAGGAGGFLYASCCLRHSASEVVSRFVHRAPLTSASALAAVLLPGIFSCATFGAIVLVVGRRHGYATSHDGRVRGLLSYNCCASQISTQSKSLIGKRRCVLPNKIHYKHAETYIGSGHSYLSRRNNSRMHARCEHSSTAKNSRAKR